MILLIALGYRYGLLQRCFGGSTNLDNNELVSSKFQDFEKQIVANRPLKLTFFKKDSVIPIINHNFNNKWTADVIFTNENIKNAKENQLDTRKLRF